MTSAPESDEKTNIELLCSNCFKDEGLKLDAERLGKATGVCYPNCNSNSGAKLTVRLLQKLTSRFFVKGSMIRTNYGGAPHLQCNFSRLSDICPPPWLEADLRLLEKTIHVGVFHYGPRMWMIGEIEPLKKLQNISERHEVIERIIREYPTMIVAQNDQFYRLRKAPSTPQNFGEYDSPPPGVFGNGRIDSPSLNVLYASPDLETCIHECRATAEDNLYLATLASARPLKLLDLTHNLSEPKDVTEFESLDLSLNLLFLAGPHSYEITREIAANAYAAGFDGLNYPSYFSLLRTGAIPFETQCGISNRLFSTWEPYPELAAYEAQKVIPNFALFGKPLAE